jgi:acyl carrier protein
LTAYYVCEEGQAVSESGVRRQLQAQLPEYMLPAIFIKLDALPLTPNGKVDRRVLPTPDLGRSRLQTKFVAPRAPVEEVLAKIMGEVLGIERVGVHDNFFELGGHSLLATQVMSRARDNFKMELPLLRLFETPTIAELALIIAEKLEKTEQENVKQLLDEFEDLSDEEAERLLALESNQNENSNWSE